MVEYIRVRPAFEEPLEAVVLTEQNAGEIMARIDAYQDFYGAEIFADSVDMRYVRYFFSEGYVNYIAMGNWVIFGEYGFVHGTQESFEEDYVILTDEPEGGTLAP